MTVQQWLNSDRNYSIGVQLYSSLEQCNVNLLRLFNRKEKPKSKAKLVYELQKYFKKYGDPELVTIVKKNPVPEYNKTSAKEKDSTPEDPNQLTFMDQLPKDLRPVRTEAHVTFIKMCELKADLNEVSPENEEEALAIQLKIHQCLRLNEVAWNKINHFLETGELPVKPKSLFSELTGAQLAKREQYKFQSISKAEKKLEKDLQKLKSKSLTEAERNRIEKSKLKTETNLIKHKEELVIIQNQINGK